LQPGQECREPFWGIAEDFGFVLTVAECRRVERRFGDIDPDRCERHAISSGFIGKREGAD
jgi:hypothetical protein